MDYGKVTATAGIPHVQIRNLVARHTNDSTAAVSNASNKSSADPFSEGGRPASTILVIVVASSAVLLLGCCMLVLRARRRYKVHAKTNSSAEDSQTSKEPAPSPACAASSIAGTESAKSTKGIEIRLVAILY